MLPGLLSSEAMEFPRPGPPSMGVMSCGLRLRGMLGCGAAGCPGAWGSCGQSGVLGVSFMVVCGWLGSIAVRAQQAHDDQREDGQGGESEKEERKLRGLPQRAKKSAHVLEDGLVKSALVP